MFPGMPAVQMNKHERKLMKMFKSLDDTNKESLIAFAEFLHTRSISLESTVEVESDIPIEPLDILRPEEESVVKAIKRLSATYPMINKEGILQPISGLMTSHIMQGEKASKVIDELELLFLNEYKNLKNNNKDVR